MKRLARTQLLDNLHRGFVLTCVAMTVYGTVVLAEFGYKYFKYIKPQIQAAKEEKERELLAEGSSDTLSVLHDSAKVLKS